MRGPVAFAASLLAFACAREFGLPASSPPPALTQFAAAPSFAAVGAQVSLSFTSNVPLSSVTGAFAGSAMACAGSALAWRCTIVAAAAMGEGDHSFSLVATSADGQVARVTPAALMVTLDFTPPVLAVSASPSPAVKGAPESFVVDSNEPLGAAPSISAAFLSGSPVCAGAIPGTRFVCTGATVADDAPVGAATFTASGQDRAGNPGSTAPVSIAVENPILPPPRVESITVTPSPANAGATLQIVLTASEPLNGCAISVAGQVADCTGQPVGAVCTCRFVVPRSLLDGNNIVLGFATSDSGTGTASTGVQIDNAPPLVNQALLAIARHALGVSDGVSAQAGAVADDSRVTYPGQGVREVRLYDAPFGNLLTKVTPSGDGSFAEVALPNTDGVSDTRLAPQEVWATGVDMAGNETLDGGVAITAGADTAPAADATKLTIRRHDVNTRDGLAGSAGAFKNSQCAIRKTNIYAPDGVTLVASGPLNADGSFAEIPFGSAASSYPMLNASGVDKCGNEGAQAATVNGNDNPPGADATRMNINRRNLTQKDGVQGSAGALFPNTAGGCALLGVKAYDGNNPTTVVGQAMQVNGDGSFPEVLFGTITSSFGTLLITALDKCGVESAPVMPLAGLDTGPVVDGAKLSMLVQPTGSPSNVTGAAGAVSSPVSILTGVLVVDVPGTGQTILAGPFLPVADGSFAQQSVGNVSLPRLYVQAVDKAQTVTVATVKNVQASFDLLGHLPQQPLPTAVAFYPLAADFDPRTVDPGVAPASVPEASGATLLGATAVDTLRATTSASAQTVTAAESFAQVPIPTGRDLAGIAFDEGRHEAVLFGGYDGDNLADTWELDGASGWTAIASPGPSARRGHAMAYDGTCVILFGGIAGPQPTDLSQETWAYSASGWQQLSPAHSPPPRWLASMSRSIAGAVLFGGREVDTLLGDTWVWTHAGPGCSGDWNHLATASAPSPRISPSMVYDSGRGKVVLFGGSSDAMPYGSAETWEFDGAAWTQNTAAAQPPINYQAPFAYDAHRGKSVLFGGQGFAEPATWEYDGVNWASVNLPSDPGPLLGQAAFFDSTRKLVFVYGGADGDTGGFFSDLWSYGGTAWTNVTASPSTRSGARVAYDIARDRVVLFGGDIDLPSGQQSGETWEFDGASWSQRAPATGALAEASGGAMAYDAARGKTVLFGGSSTQAGLFGYTVEWDGNAWTGVSFPADVAPTARAGATMAYDSSRSRMVLFGGADINGRNNDTWEYDGRVWKQITTANPPLARDQAAMAYHASSGLMVLFGGLLDTGAAGDTCTYNGMDWTCSTLAGPSARSRASMAYDAARQMVVLTGGAPSGDAWEFDGAAWAAAATNGPKNRLDAPLVYDAARRRVLAFGGCAGCTTAVSGTNYSDLWSLTAAAPHARWAAQAFAFPLDAQAMPSALKATYCGAGSGSGSPSDGVQLYGWNWSTGGWIPQGQINSPDANPSNCISPPLAGTLTDYIGPGRLWLLAVPSNPSSAPVGAGLPSTLATDYVRLDTTYTLP